MLRASPSQSLRTILVLMAAYLLALPAYAKYSGGTGEPNDPYQIATPEDLILLGETAADYDKHFILIDDIDLAGYVFDRAVIAPDMNDMEDGFQGTSFTGIFDGNEHTISRLSIEGGRCLGLFGCLDSGAMISNLRMEAVDVNGIGIYVGGLVGVNYDGSVTNCYSNGTVNGGWHVGGLVGVNGGSIADCYSTGKVTASMNVGGLVGGNNGSITNCYSNGTVDGDWWVGGLVGYNLGSIANCYSTGKVDGNYRVGGLVGENYHSSITSSLWDVETSGLASMCGYGRYDDSFGKTTGEMQTASTFLDAGWDFVGEIVNGPNDIWKIAEGLDYPRLWWEQYDGQVTVELGQTFPVTLESNPSTGYGWEWVDTEDSIVEQVGEAEFIPHETGDPPLAGAGGWEIFTFKAVSSGQMTLKLVYRRAWEEGVEPLKTFLLDVTIP
jgi:predicted secreted protein